VTGSSTCWAPVIFPLRIRPGPTTTDAGCRDTSPPDTTMSSSSTPPGAADEVNLSCLSPLAPPFHPEGNSAGRSKLRRWADDDDDLQSDGESSSDMSPATASASWLPSVGAQKLVPPVVEPLRPPLRSILMRAGDESLPAVGAQSPVRDAAPRPRRHRHRRQSRPRPQLVHGLPLRGRNNLLPPRRAPAHQRLEPRVSRHHCVMSPNARGWQDILPWNPP
jgi:hypothetical protein